MKNPSRVLVSTCLATLTALALAAPPASAQVPRSLNDLVLGARSRPQVELQVLGDTFQGMPVFSAAPYVLWPVGEAKHLPSMDPEVAARWIDAAAESLGIAGFRAHHVESWTWREATVFSFALEHDGLELWLARVQVHFGDGKLIGLALDVPQPLLGIEPFEGDLPRDGSFVLFAQRGENGYRAVPSAATVTQTATHTITTVR